MIPEGLELAVGFVTGVFFGTAFGALLLGALSSGAREDPRMAAFLAGVRYEKNRQHRVRRQLLHGDEATEMGVIEA